LTRGAIAAKEPRVLTSEMRAALELPVVARPSYPWAFACVVVGTACVPLLLASLWTLAAAALALGFVVFPAIRWLEYRHASWREGVYRTGREAVARVLDVEPAGSQRRDHIVRLEFSAGGAKVRASVIGCPLARRGLMPGEDVVVLYDAKSPERCLVVARSQPEIVDAIFED
jgi:hypothetical protein